MTPLSCKVLMSSANMSDRRQTVAVSDVRELGVQCALEASWRSLMDLVGLYFIQVSFYLYS